MGAQAKRVFEWRKQRPVDASALWNTLATVNEQILECLETLGSLSLVRLQLLLLSRCRVLFVHDGQFVRADRRTRSRTADAI